MFCFSKFSKKVVLSMILGVLLFSSCRKDDSHPITWRFWVDKSKSRLIKFSKDGTVRDLYNLDNTKKDRYEADEKSIVIYHKTYGNRDTVSANILLVDDKMLVLQYFKSKIIDTLKKADRNDAIIGTWIPSFGEYRLDTFDIMRKDLFDSKKTDMNNKKEYFRYKFINDSILEFNFFEKGVVERYNYTLSYDNLLLLLSTKESTISLQRK